MRISLRPVLLGLILLVAVVGLVQVVPATNSQPNATSGASDGQCTSEHPGVSVVVDFGIEADQAPVVKCASGFNVASSSVSNQLSGWQLFAAAGLKVEGTSEYPVGFACRIEGYPAPTDQPCTSTPTYAQGHWAYFYATAGDTKWHFSAAGSADRKPNCGDVDGWLFVKGETTNGTSAAAAPSFEPKAFRCAP